MGDGDMLDSNKVYGGYDWSFILFMIGCMQEERGQLRIGLKERSAYGTPSRGRGLSVVVMLDLIKQKQEKKSNGQRSLEGVLSV